MPRSWIALALVGQAAASAGWWIVLATVPASRAYFPDAGAFWLADVALIATTLAAAFAVWRARAWATAALWLSAGAIGYAALYCVVAGTPIAIALMLPSAAVAIGLARIGARA